jgi:SSS family solute:Na+ symporter
MWIWGKVDPAALSIIALSPNAAGMAENMYRALWSWLVCVGVTIAVSLLTPRLADAQLEGLVYGCTKLPVEAAVPLVQRPVFWAVVVFVVFVSLNVVFW